MADEDLPLNELLERSRRNLGLSQAEVARQIAVDPGTVSRWEGGAVIPTGKNYTELIRVLKISRNVAAEARDLQRRRESPSGADVTEALQRIEQLILGLSARVGDVERALTALRPPEASEG